MCKDKWNSIHGDYKKNSYHHKGMWHNTCYWDLIAKEWDKHHPPWQFNEDCYKAIEVFQGEQNVHVPPNVRDLQAPSDGDYSQPREDS
jgi:hypothetical protein